MDDHAATIETLTAIVAASHWNPAMRCITSCGHAVNLASADLPRPEVMLALDLERLSSKWPSNKDNGMTTCNNKISRGQGKDLSCERDCQTIPDSLEGTKVVKLVSLHCHQ